MAKIKPEFEVCDEFVEIANQLKEKYPDQFFNKRTEALRCMMITNKERPDSGKLISLKNVGMPMALDTPYHFYVITYSKDWEEFNESQKARLVSWVLFSLPDEEDEERFIMPDLKDHSVVLRTFGVDWLDDPSAKNPLDGDTEWVSEKGRLIS